MSSNDDSTEVPMFLRTPADFGAIIREHRRRAGLTQANFAAKAGVGRQWIVEVEKGKPGAHLGMILRTLRALDISLVVDEQGRKKRKMSGYRGGVDLDELLNSLRRKGS
jgi:HTH-type transcriptional regulator / antitoxin HipB